MRSFLLVFHLSCPRHLAFELGAKYIILWPSRAQHTSFAGDLKSKNVLLTKVQPPELNLHVHVL